MLPKFLDYISKECLGVGNMIDDMMEAIFEQVRSEYMDLRG